MTWFQRLLSAAFLIGDAIYFVTAPFRWVLRRISP